MVFAALISGFIGNVIQAYVMAYILAISGTAQCCGGLTIATAVFVAFIFTPSFADHIWYAAALRGRCIPRFD